MRPRPDPLAEIQVECPGWWRNKDKTERVHTEVIVVKRGALPPSTTMCKACRDAFIAIANLPTKEEVRT